MDFGTSLRRIYVSQTMGNIVESPIEVIRQVFESLFRSKTLDIRWKIVWL